MNQSLLALAFSMCIGVTANAQMARGNSQKFLGNITTSYNWTEYCDPQECSNSYKYTDYWNQVTCENATKWGSVHQNWGRFNWTNADRTYNYCKQNGIIFKFHALIWGSQYPSWIKTLSVEDTKKAIIEWFDEVKKHYPDLQIIDVVNEAIYSGGGYHSPYAETKIIQALGSLAEDRAQGETGIRPSYNCTTNGYPNTNSYQWIAEAFRLARDRWPNAILIYNDYNTFRWQRTEFINLINGLKACGAPIDASGNQAHDLNDMSGYDFKNALEEIHNKTNMPTYITEYDICKNDDNTQLTRYKEQFPIMWEADYVCGVTLWGWVFGKTWVNDNGVKGASGLIRDCQKRPAFEWLENYMKSDAAKNAKSQIVVGSKRTTLTVDAQLSANTAVVGDEVTISVNASVSDGRIKNVMILSGNTQIADMYTEPYVATFTPEYPGLNNIQVVAFDQEDNTVAKYLTLTVLEPMEPYNGTPFSIPGKVEAEEYNLGGEGNAYHDKDSQNRNGGYRANEGVDMSDNAIGYMERGEWLKYTINVKNEGLYSITSMLASDNGTGAFMLYIDDEPITNSIVAPNTGSYSNFQPVVTDGVYLKEGEHILKLEVTTNWFDLDNMTFDLTTAAEELIASDVVSVTPNPAEDHLSVNVENASLELYDATGRKVASSSNNELDLANNLNGIYTLRIYTPNNVVVRKVVIK